MAKPWLIESVGGFIEIRHKIEVKIVIINSTGSSFSIAIVSIHIFLRQYVVAPGKLILLVAICIPYKRSSSAACRR